MMTLENLEKSGLHMHPNDVWSQDHNDIVVQQQIVTVQVHNQCPISDEIRFSIIEGVRNLPGIWDSQREKTSGATRKELFAEVARQISAQHALEPPMMSDEVEKQWKNLKDTFIKTRKKVNYNSDGSLVPPKWKFYTFLTFLDSLNRKRPSSRYEEDDLLPPNLMQIKRLREDDPEDDDEYLGFCRSLVYSIRQIGQRDRIAFLKLKKQIQDMVHEAEMTCIMSHMR